MARYAPYLFAQRPGQTRKGLRRGPGKAFPGGGVGGRPLTLWIAFFSGRNEETRKASLHGGLRGRTLQGNPPRGVPACLQPRTGAVHRALQQKSAGEQEGAVKQLRNHTAETRLEAKIVRIKLQLEEMGPISPNDRAFNVERGKVVAQLNAACRTLLGLKQGRFNFHGGQGNTIRQRPE